MLRKKRRNDLAGLSAVAGPRKQALVAEVTPLAHKEQLHTGNAGLSGNGDDIQIAPFPADVLLLLHLAQCADLIAQVRCLFEFQPHRGLFHLLDPTPNHVRRLALKEQGRVPHVLCVGLRRDEIDARCRAALDLVLQTGA